MVNVNLFMSFTIVGTVFEPDKRFEAKHLSQEFEGAVHVLPVPQETGIMSVKIHT